MATTIVLLPFCTYLHLYFDDNSSYVEFFGYRYYHFFDDTRSFVWILSIKVIPLLLLIIWFLTNPFWWRYFVFAQLIYWIDSLVRETFIYNDVLEENLELLSVVLNLIVIGLLLTVERWRVRKTGASKTIETKKNWWIQNYERLYKTISKETQGLTEAKQVLGKKEYLRKLIIIKTFINSSLENLAPNTTNAKQKGKWDFLIIALVVFIPFLLYSYTFIPENVKDYAILGLTIHSYGFVDVYTFYWFVCMKLGIFLPTVIWFVTARDWWRYAILSPIVLTIYQLVEAFASYEIADEASLFKVLPLTIAIVGFLIWLVHIIRHKTKVLELYDGITQEIEDILPKISNHTELFSEKEAKFKDLKENTKGIQEKQRMDLLMDLREELLKEYALKNRL